MTRIGGWGTPSIEKKKHKQVTTHETTPPYLYRTVQTAEPPVSDPDNESSTLPPALCNHETIQSCTVLFCTRAGLYCTCGSACTRRCGTVHPPSPAAHAMMQFNNRNISHARQRRSSFAGSNLQADTVQILVAVFVPFLYRHGYAGRRG